MGEFRVINQNRTTEATTEAHNEDIIDLCETYVANHDREVLSAKERELQNWKSEEVYVEVPNNGQPTMSTTWVIKQKIIDGKYALKARLCARGFEEEQFFRTDSPTCS